MVNVGEQGGHDLLHQPVADQPGRRVHQEIQQDVAPEKEGVDPDLVQLPVGPVVHGGGHGGGRHHRAEGAGGGEDGV